MTDDGSSAEADDTDRPVEKRWVVQDLGASEPPRLGEVEDLPGGGVRVRFRTGETVEWDELPRSARPVVEGSLPWQVAVERPALLSRMTTEPGEVLSLVIREAGAPMAAGDLQAKLLSLRLIKAAGARPGDRGGDAPAWEDVWRKGRPALVRHAHIVAERNAYGWSDTAVEKAAASAPRAAARRPAEAPNVERMLGQVINARANADRAQEARERLRDLARQDLLTPVQRAAGAATSALIGEVIDWTNLPAPTGLDGPVLDVFLDLAARQQAWGYLARLAADPSHPRLASEAADQLAGASHAGAGDALAVAFEELLDQAAAGRLDADGLAPQLTRLARAAARPTPSALIDPALRLLAAVAGLRGSEDARRETTAALVDLAGGASPADLAIVVLGSDATVLDLALRAGAQEPFERSEPRAALLEAAAEATPEVLVTPAYWAGLRGDVLPALCAKEHLGRLLCAPDGLAGTVTGPAIDEVLATGDLRALLAMELWPTPLRALVDPVHWAAGVRRAGTAAGETSLLVRALEAVEEDARLLLERDPHPA